MDLQTEIDVAQNSASKVNGTFRLEAPTINLGYLGKGSSVPAYLVRRSVSSDINDMVSGVTM